MTTATDVELICRDHPEWIRQSDETREDYQLRMMQVMCEISPGLGARLAQKWAREFNGGNETKPRESFATEGQGK